MVRNLLIAAVLIQGGICSAQQQLENTSFENWQNVGGPEEEPTEWSSIKTSDAGSFINSSAPQVCERSTDSHTGSYSVRLENKSVFGIVATGTLTNGRAHGDTNPENGYVFTDATDSQWNTAMTDKPDSLVGWFKYAPVSGDKAKVEAIIHSGAAQNPENGTSGNFVAKARFTTTATASSWTRFSVPFTYFNANASTHILVVMTAGDSTIAKAGSVAYFDDIELVYNVVGVNELDLNDIKVFNNSQRICVDLSSKNSYEITLKLFDLQGRELLKVNNLTKGINYLEKPKSNGVYLVNISLDGKMVTKKIVINN